ncbi:MAG: S53 family peptidase [Methylobacter sp.]
MKILFRLTLLALACTNAYAEPGQSPRRGSILIPDTTVELPDQVGKHAHTNHMIFIPQQGQGATPLALTPAGESPSSISSAYQFTPTGSQTIVIVDAYDYPTAENDLNVFSQQFNLPSCTKANGCFQVVYAKGVKPRANCGWAQEAALDIEWAHAMAPSAKIVLVEAASSSFSDLLKAVDVGTNIITQNGGKGELSMSWGGSEFSSETSYDSHFTNPNVVYFAASGDTGGKVIYPSASPNVVSAGGTTIKRDSSGKFIGETAWSGSGGGPSLYENMPVYQTGILTGSKRGTPDFSFDADPASGVSVYDSTSCNGVSGWLVFGGTSVAAPALAGIVNSAGHFYSGSQDQLSVIYNSYSSSTYITDFMDVMSGSAGSYTANTGWDFTTGVGSNLGLLGK